MINEQDQLIHTLSNLSAPELCELTRTLEQKWGVKAVPQPAPPLILVPTKLDLLPIQVQTEFNVVMKSFPPDKKMAVLKVVREITGLGLKEVKDFLESLPKVVKESLSKVEANELVAKLQAVGAEVITE